LKKREAEDAEHFELSHEQQSKANVEFTQRQMLLFLQNEDEFARRMIFHRRRQRSKRPNTSESVCRARREHEAKAF